MPRVWLFPAAVRLTRGPFALAPVGGRAFGLVLVSAGILLLGMAASPLLAGAQSSQCTPTDGKVCFTPEPEQGVPLDSLRTVTKPTDPQLAPGGMFVRNQSALVALGKALFWDQQVGSDGQACGSCHFSAGADARTKNQVSPGLKANPLDTTFQLGSGPNHQLTTADFPTPTTAQCNGHVCDVVSSAGVFLRQFSSIQSNGFGLQAPRPAFDRQAMDNCRSSTLDTANFQVGGVNVRRVEPRNTPTMINAMFNNRNFWDSRAQDVFNGVNPFGARDTSVSVFENNGGVFAQATPVQVRIAFSSLASQAVGPPLSEFEMSCSNRTFPDVGHKLLTSTTTPLAQQEVSANDSVLGPISFARFGLANNKGLFVNYPALVAAAFQPRWWDSIVPVNAGAAGRRPQIEANFSLFWGLAVQAYIETLKADQSRFDLFIDSNCATGKLSPSELSGLEIFQSARGTTPVPCNPSSRVPLKLSSGFDADTRCTACHGGPETTAANIDAVRNDARLERMAMPNGGCAIYDAGHFNTGVRPTNDDLALGGLDNSNHPLGETALAIAGTLQTLVPTSVAPFGLVPPMGGTVNCDGPNVNGTFKAPQLRNVELTGPYFHNGGKLTLEQVVDFYNRGGDFSNPGEFDPNVHQLNLADQDKIDLVAFLKALTDERVATEKAPFDHPGICVANGEVGTEIQVETDTPLPGSGPNPIPRAKDNVQCQPASGAGGLPTRIVPFRNHLTTRR